MTGHIAFFGHNPKDAAVRRRAQAFRKAGLDVTGFMPRRGPPVPAPWPLIDLGRTDDNAYLQRIASILSGTRRAARHADILRNCDVLYARNLDMLAIAARVRSKLEIKVPLVYECLDIHHRLSGDSRSARLFRKLEGRLLAQTDLVVVSSPRFETEHFTRYFPGKYRHMLIENRLIDDPALPPRPVRPPPNPAAPLRIGWFGNLRCRASFNLLNGLVRRFPGQVQVSLRGYPASSVFPDLAAEISGLPGITYHGPYHAPDDLAGIYSDVDLIWACDWYERGANSLWLLPNRIYEGGYFTTPALVAAGTETARWVSAHGSGIVLEDPLDASLEKHIEAILSDRSALAALFDRVAQVPRNAFVEQPTTTHDMLSQLHIKS
ncbi:MAG: hypothetical protein KKI16_07940 [Alphaproteobacteria bacterium]|nr:hypothetical protein [Alphaproteobacteria bacterium]